MRLSILPVILLLGACAVAPPSLPPPTDAAAARCIDLYATLDRAVAEHGTTPSYPVRIEGFPYLRVDRFLASYREQPLDRAEREAWLERLARLDLVAREVELKSLPPSARADLTEVAGSEDLSMAVARCSHLLQAQYIADPRRFRALRERATVADDYRTLNRILGLYPLTALPVQYGIYRWHRETHRTFLVPRAELPVQGELHRYRPPPGTAVVALPELSRDALGIPVIDEARVDALYQAHAPVWEIDVADDFDRPGAPYWKADGQPTVDTGQPVVYRYLSYTRWQGEALLQLNYLVWFSKRPRTGPLDILGGPLDALIWRVTLDLKGRPLLYDSIHSCGCYHKFFPTASLRLRPESLALPEPPLIPQAAPALLPEERVVLRVASGTHYIQQVYGLEITEGIPYRWRPYRDLYTVPMAGDGRRSLFGPDGLVPGTERLERWLLWPMGVPSPGAMRERGHHATAFVGRRHFDDPYLLEELFEPAARERRGNEGLSGM